VAAGKAAPGMALAAAEVLGDRVAAGLVTLLASPRMGAAAQSTRPAGLDERWQLIETSHPTPDAGSEAAGRAALALADRAIDADDLLLVCLSGGASAMLVVPAPGVTLDDKRATTQILLRAGLDIGSMNLVRRHLSAIKGGQLAARAARSLTLAISDVSSPVDDDPAVIGSGPTVADATTFDDALALLRHRNLIDALPLGALNHLDAGAAGRASGPVAPGDNRLRHAEYRVIATRRDAMRWAADAAHSLGYHVHVHEAAVTGVARTAGDRLRDAARSLKRPACVIASGETTVEVAGDGRGGRNQELALGVVEWLADDGPAALVSIGSDGIDGPTDAAGALVTSETSTALGRDARARVTSAFARNDSYPLLDELGALVRTGPTGTNVGDLQILLLG
jgi:glycerate-2-kinase